MKRSGSGDTVRGRVEEAAGVIADDPELRRKGRIDQGAGKVKDAVDRVRDVLTDRGRRR
jgi:uncharacterized protein YjbJ (UPF0337 family)